jgi:hypothetical protein
VSNDSNMNRSVMLRRKAAKRTLPFDLAAGELLVSQSEDIPATKKLRLEEPLPTTTDEATRKTASPDLSVGLLHPTVDNDDDANADTVTDTQPNDGATRATGSWTADEDVQLTRAVANTSKKRRGKEYMTDWVAVVALVPGRTRSQCKGRWQKLSDPSIDRANGRTGKWAADEDNKLKNAVQRHGGKDWDAITASVPGRTKQQCHNRWRDALNPSIALTAARKGKWTEDEDSKLKDAVQTHGDKNRCAIAALTDTQPNAGASTWATGSWTLQEGAKLTSAVANTRKMRWGKEYKRYWDAISALVPGRTRKQCLSRWHDVLDPNIVRVTGSKSKWTADEDSKLKDAVQTHGGKNWAAISALVPGRTRSKCKSRWHNALNPSIGRANRRTCKWSEDEDIKLKVAVQTHGDKDWNAILALVPGRTRSQCSNRWHNALEPTIALTA